MFNKRLTSSSIYTRFDMSKTVTIGLIALFVTLSVLFLFILPAWASDQPVDGQAAGTVGVSVGVSALVNQLIEKFKPQNNQVEQAEEKASQYSLIGLNNRLQSIEITNKRLHKQIDVLDRKLRVTERYLRKKFPDDFDPKTTL